VVNVSWSWSLSEITRNLEVRGVGGDAEARAALAGEIHAILARGMRDALGGADDVLFVCAAGNTGEEVGREGALPAGLELPNLLVVGAVDGAGAVTSFTSFGPEVDVFADGARIESVIPGGAHLRLSGTSMATPQVTNLAAKLLALRPALSPREVSDLVVRGGERVSRDGRELVLLDPARSLELLHEG